MQARGQNGREMPAVRQGAPAKNAYLPTPLPEQFFD
jgi:hypothetical protein